MSCKASIRAKSALVQANRLAQQQAAYRLLVAVLVYSGCDVPTAGLAGAGSIGHQFVAPESPLQACVEYCELAQELCAGATECEKECAAEMLDATAFCEDKVGLKYACFLANASPERCAWQGGLCWDQQVDAARCLLEHGCWEDPHLCEPSKVWVDQCSCNKTCKSQIYYGTSCTPDFGVTHCDCYVDGALAGQCEQTELICDIWTSCCRQYFNL